MFTDCIGNLEGLRVVKSQTINQVGQGTFCNRIQAGVVGQLRHEFSARVLSRANTNPGVFVGLTNKSWDGSQLKWGVKGEEYEFIIFIFKMGIKVLVVIYYLF